MRRAIPLATLALLSASCIEPLDTQTEPEVTTVRITISGTGAASQVVTWNTTDNSVSPATVTMPSGSTRTISAEFLKANGTPEPLLNPINFRLDLTLSGTRVQFTKTGPFTAEMVAQANGTPSTFALSVFHIDEGHVEYGPSNAISVTVN